MKQTGADIAYQLLREEKLPIYYKDLMNQVFQQLGAKPKEITADRLAALHTEISLDSRFAYQGKHMWSLVEWIPQRGVKSLEELATPPVVVDKNRRKKLLEEIQETFSGEEPETPEAEPVE